MGVPEGFVVISAVVRREVRDRLHQAAVDEESSVSAMIAEWINSGVGAPLLRSDKVQKVRAVKDELMVSLPRAYLRRSGLGKGDELTLAYSDAALMVTRK